MAVVPMKKVLILGLKKERKHILEFLQRQEVLEITDEVAEDDLLKKMDVSASQAVFLRNAGQAEQALLVLDKYVPEKKGMLDSFAGRDSAHSGRV